MSILNVIAGRRSRRKLKIAAVIAVRNEAHYLRFLLPRLEREAIDVIVLDHESTDETAELLRGAAVLQTVSFPFSGYFSLTQQLELKRQLIEPLEHDWVIHQDADEVLEHRDPSRSLRAAIEEADEEGFTALNFEEFVFLPEPGRDYQGRDYARRMRRYYFFAPEPNRLNRAWKSSAKLDNLAALGHRLAGDPEALRIAPRNHVLRHYPILSQAHAFMKYPTRVFDAREVAEGAHWNRIALTPEMLRLPSRSRFLRSLGLWRRTWSRECPTDRHYWQWTDAERGSA